MPENDLAAPVDRRTRWRPLWLAGACFLAVVVVALAAGAVAAIAFDRLMGVDRARAYAAGELQTLMVERLAAVLFAFQAASVAGVLLVARRYRGQGFEILPFGLPKRAALVLLLSIVGVFLISGLYGSAVYQFDHSEMSQDLSPFAEMMKTDAWWLVLLAAGVGAPLAEEFLFRGLLYGLLREAPSGKVVAGIVTAAAWAVLHFNYATYGVIAIFLIGLYFAWLREKTASLLPPIVCHAVYNSLIVLALRVSPEVAGAVGP